MVSFRLGLSLNVFRGNPDFLAETVAYFLLLQTSYKKQALNCTVCIVSISELILYYGDKMSWGIFFDIREDLVRPVLPQGQRIVSAEHYLQSVA